MHLDCLLGIHDLKPIGDGYGHGPDAEFRPMKCSRCRHEELTAVWKETPDLLGPHFLSKLMSIIAVGVSLSLLLYVFRENVAAWIDSWPKFM